jgi:hypothetical protein
MALDQTVLTNEILKLIDPTCEGFVAYPETREDAITNWANAYNTYAVAAMDVSGDVLLTSNLAGFTSTLLSLIPTIPPGGSILEAANAFDTAFITYWAGATFNILIPPPPPNDVPIPPAINNGIFGLEATSIVTTVTAGVLSANLQQEFAIISSDTATKAAGLASAFHAATTSAVIATIVGVDTTPTPAGPYPITNTNTIF